MSANPARGGKGGGRGRGGGGGGGGGLGNDRRRSGAFAEAAGSAGAWFAEGTAEYFWYRLLTTLDSHRLSMHLSQLWISRLWEAALGDHSARNAACAADGGVTGAVEGTEGTEGGGDGGVGGGGGGGGSSSGGASVDEAEGVLRCCILSKFLGLLLFHPLCDGHVASGAPDAVSATRAAGGTSCPFDIFYALVEARRRDRLLLCVPVRSPP